MVHLRVQICVIGAPTSGKTAFVQMVHSNGVTFPKNYMMTTGCDLVVNEVPVDESNTVEMLIYDVAGQKEYETLVPSYLSQASAFILMYDVSNKVTFEACTRWLNIVKTVNKDMVGFLVANKTDLIDKAEVTERQANDIASANNLSFYKCSTLRGVGVHEPIREIARLFLDAYNKRVEQMTQLQ